MLVSARVRGVELPLPPLPVPTPRIARRVASPPERVRSRIVPLLPLGSAVEGPPSGEGGTSEPEGSGFGAFGGRARSTGGLAAGANAATEAEAAEEAGVVEAPELVLLPLEPAAPLPLAYKPEEDE